MNHHPVNTPQEELLAKLVSGTISESEHQALTQQAQDDPQLQADINSARHLWETSGQLSLYHKIECCKKQDFELVKARMLNMSMQNTRRASLQMTTRRLVTAAAAAAIIATAIYLHLQVPGFGRWDAVVSNNHIENVMLPDHSQVTLNNHSRLVYLKGTDHAKRLVKLKGEAFFDVRKMADKPFIITSGNTTIQVIGTSFNVKNEGLKEFTQVTVTEGIVKLTADDQELLLTKGETGTYRNGRLEKAPKPDANAIYWKNHILQFTDNSLSEVIGILTENLSDIKSVQVNTKSDQIRITTKFENQNLSAILEELSIHFNKKFTLNDGILVISD